MTEAHSLIAMRGIVKSFPGVHALEGVDFMLRRGEIHALMGENGAGKSTLMKILTGADRPDHGVIELDGAPIQVRSPQHAQALGISTVYQEINLCTNISVAENILLGHEPRRFWGIDWKTMNSLAQAALARLGIDIDVTQPLGSFSIAIQQMAAIARALQIAATNVLILDEPTSSLDAHETSKLFAVMRQLKAEGIGIVFITHFLDQVYAVADRATILRNGALVGTYHLSELSRVELVGKMLGRTVGELDAMSNAKAMQRSDQAHEPVVEAQALGLTGVLAPTDLELRAGEVVGVAGLLGSGRTELARLLFGAVAPDTGSLVIRGAKVDQFSPLAALTYGIALCPEDRKAEGIVGDLSIRENIVLALQARNGWFRFLDRRRQDELAEQYIKLLRIRTPSPNQPVKHLSGGNQQKVILARWLATEPHVLILDEPTRGIDVGAKVEIQKLALELVKDGLAILFISSELEEVLRISDRIVVLRDRQRVADYAGDVDDQTLLQTMSGAL
jgi:simple sugar transport system ATP-binding protein